MLVLTRKKWESFEIGENIKVTVLEVRGDRVRIGINAPEDVAVNRTEVVLANGRNVARKSKKM